MEPGNIPMDFLVFLYKTRRLNPRSNDSLESIVDEYWESFQ